MMSSMDRDIFGRPSVDNTGKFMDGFGRQLGEAPRLGGFSDRRARPPISVRPVARPQPFQPQPAPPQFGQVEEQPQFNQQGMQQMMQMMQQMMQMISKFSNQGGFGGGFGGEYGGGMGGGFGRGYGSMGGPFGQMMGPMPRPTPRFNYFSQSPFGRY